MVDCFWCLHSEECANTNQSWAREYVKYHSFSFLVFFLFPWLETWFYICLIFFVSTTNLPSNFPSHVIIVQIWFNFTSWRNFSWRLLISEDCSLDLVHGWDIGEPLSWGPLTLLSCEGSSDLRGLCLYFCILFHFDRVSMRKYTWKVNGLRFCRWGNEFILHPHLIILLEE